MKKFAFFYLALTILTYAAVVDVSYVVKGGYAPLGYYKETVAGVTTKTTVSNSLSASLEIHSRTKTFDNFYFGAGVGFLGSGTLGTAISGSDELGVDYFPIYFIMQYEPPSQHYSDFLMYFSFRGGMSYEKDMGRIQSDVGFSTSYSAASPYGGISWGFEKSGIIIEGFYDFNIGAAADLTNLGETLIMNTRRMGLSMGYRFNSANR